MYALRAITRRAPRIAPQLANYTTKSSALRPALQSISKPSSILASRYPSITSHFSTSASRSDSSGQELALKLQSEISFESENSETNHDSDSGVSDFLGRNDFWTLKDTEGEQDVVLERAYDGDEKIVRNSSCVRMCLVH